MARTAASNRQARSNPVARTVSKARIGYEPTLSGAVDFADLDDALPVTLGILYPTAAYTVTFGTVVVLQGEPAAGASTPSAEDQAGTGFTLALAEAPGLGASVRVPWEVSP